MSYLLSERGLEGAIKKFMGPMPTWNQMADYLFKPLSVKPTKRSVATSMNKPIFGSKKNILYRNDEINYWMQM